MISRKEENRFSSTMHVSFFWPHLPILSSHKKQTTHNTRKHNSQQIIWVEQVVPTIKGILQNQVSQSSANIDVQWPANDARLAPCQWFWPCPPSTWLLASNTTTTPLTGQYLPFLYNVAFRLRESFTIMVNNLVWCCSRLVPKVLGLVHMLNLCCWPASPCWGKRWQWRWWRRW
jgi:hypothetical protein